MKEKKRPKSSNNYVGTDDVRNPGGKDLVLNRMINHYKALANMKPKVIIEPPPQHVSKKNCDSNVIEIKSSR